MKAVLCIRNLEDSPQIIRVLQHFGYEVQVVSRLDDDIAKDASLLVLSAQAFQGDSQKIVNHDTEILKIVIDDMGWTTASECARWMGVDEVVIGAPVASNIYCAVYNLLNRTRRMATHAYFRWTRSALSPSLMVEKESVHKSLIDNSENRRLERHMVSASIEERFFRNQTRGYLSNQHLAAILYRLSRSSFSGVLHLRRPGLHWVFAFEQGEIYDLDARDASGFFAFKTETEDSPSRSQCTESENDQEDHQNAGESYEAWLRSRILESFAWPEAQYEYREGNRPHQVNSRRSLSANEMIELIFEGVDHYMPKAQIFEVTQSCLPYFLKLKDNADAPTVKHARTLAVVERLKKGDNMTEMLATFDSEYPVHQVVYLGLVMGQIDWIV